MVLENPLGRQSEPAQEEQPRSLDIVYAEVKDRLSVQLHQIEALDGKAGTLMFVAGIILGIGAAAQAVFLGQTRSFFSLLLFSLSIICYFVTAFFCLKGWTARP